MDFRWILGVYILQISKSISTDQNHAKSSEYGSGVVLSGAGWPRVVLNGSGWSWVILGGPGPFLQHFMEILDAGPTRKIHLVERAGASSV